MANTIAVYMLQYFATVPANIAIPAMHTANTHNVLAISYGRE